VRIDVMLVMFFMIFTVLISQLYCHACLYGEM